MARRLKLKTTPNALRRTRLAPSGDPDGFASKRRRTLFCAQLRPDPRALASTGLVLEGRINSCALKGYAGDALQD